MIRDRITGAPATRVDRVRIVWREGPLKLATCPVRSLTPETRDVLRWFDQTHELQVGFGAATWHRHSLPGPGGLGDQDARLMAGLDLVRDEKNLLLNDRPRSKRRTPQNRRGRRG